MKEKTEKQLKMLAKELLQWYENEENILLIDFFTQKGISSNEWKKYAQQSEVFKEALQKAEELCETRLVMGGLTGKLNQSFASFVLKNVMGYNDKPEKNVKQDDEIDYILNLSDDELSKKAVDIAKKILQGGL